MISDELQRQKSLDITASFIVQAPAGSGKTELLTQRYLKLLSLSLQPESVVALTFTNKAVADLKSRVLHSLELTTEPIEHHKKITFKLAQQVLQQDKKYSWNLLKNPHRFNISTIDSLAAKIISNHSDKSNFVIKRIADDFTTHSFYLEASRQTLQQIETETSVLNLLTHFEGNSTKFIHLVRDMLQIRDKWLLQVTKSTKINMAAMRKCIKHIQHNYLQKIQQLAADELGTTFFNLCTSNVKLKHITNIPNTIEEWQQFKELLFTKAGKIRVNIGTFFTKKHKQEFTAITNNFSYDFCQTILAVQILPHNNIDKHLMSDIIKVLLIANFQLQELFNTNHQTDFMQVMLDANSALDTDRHINDISLSLDYSIEHILIDEFQDTSYIQLSLIEKIVQHWTADSGRTLFLVGDPMQSIYLFRGAQVGVFLQAKSDGIAGVPLENLVLEQNFRSTQNVVKSNNKIFQRIFPIKDDIDNGCISFTKSISNNSTINTNSLNIYPFLQHQEEDEAQAVINIIAANPHKEIAILCINRSHLKAITNTLRNKHIHFEAIKQYKLINNIYTIDLLNIVHILLDPTHRLAWFSILHSPSCGLLLNDILKLSKGDILQNLSHPQGLSTDGMRRVRSIWQVFEYAITNTGSFSFVDIFTTVINNLHITQYNTKIETYINQKFSEILHTCEQQNKLNITIIKGYLQNVYAPTIPSNIKIMTVHESKGLEFDIVIFPALGREKKADNTKLIYLNEFKNKEILLAVPSTTHKENYIYLREIEKNRAHYENIRLLYVALTRAKSQLHLLGAVGKSFKPTKRSLLHLLWKEIGYLWEDINTKHTSHQTTKLPQEVWGRYDFVVAKNKKILRLEQERHINYQKSYAKILGTIVHKFLQKEQYNPSDIVIKNKLISNGYNDVKNGVKTIKKILKNTKNSPDFDFIFAPRANTQVEVEFTSKEQTIIIDRLFIVDGIMWIIDYKTNVYNNETTVENFIELQKKQHQKQLQNYKNVLKKIYIQPIKTAIFLTSIGRMVILD